MAYTEVYAAHRVYEDAEYNPRSEFLALFTDYDAAFSVAHKSSPAISEANLKSLGVKKLPVYRAASEFFDLQRNAIRARALAKLTDEEKGALGL